MIQCPQCGRPVAGRLCSGVCPECLATSMLDDWNDLAEETSSVPDEPVITRVADYDVLRVLGRGGMGVVCRARDRLLGREVALKLIHSGVLASDEELRRFRLEAETVASLRHPNLIVVHEAGEADGQPYFTMTLADGGSLAQRLRDQGPMESAAAARLVQPVAGAIHHAHTRGVLHRDLKPGNILFDHDGTPLVSDFGLARFTSSASVTKSGALLGTPAYIAPEVASGAAGHTTSSDVYALGVLLFECLTGRTPFENDAPLALLKSITEDEPPAPSSLVKDIDRDLEAVCLRALEKDPARRYASAEALATDLAHWLADEPVTARHPPVTERFWRWAERNQTRAVLYSMAVITVFILFMLSAVMNIVMSTEQSRTADAMHQSEVRRAVLLRDYAVQFLHSPATMPRALPHLTEASSLTTDNVLQDQAIRLRLRVVQRLAPQSLVQWKVKGQQPLLTWSPDSRIAACRDGEQVHAYDLQTGRETGDASAATLTTTSPAMPLVTVNDGSARRALHSPDGRSLLISSREGVSLHLAPPPLPMWQGSGLERVWFDAQSRLLLQVKGQPIREFDHHGQIVDAPDAALPADAPAPEPAVTTTVESGGLVRVWRGEPGVNELCAPLVHGAEVITVLLDAAQHYAATLTRDHSLRVWELATALPVTPPLPVPRDAEHLLWNEQSDRLVVWGPQSAIWFDW